ncbi:hypothetical protein Tco_0675521 [Tanacetum coccineum]
MGTYLQYAALTTRSYELQTTPSPDAKLSDICFGTSAANNPTLSGASDMSIDLSGENEADGPKPPSNETPTPLNQTPTPSNEIPSLSSPSFRGKLLSNSGQYRQREEKMYEREVSERGGGGGGTKLKFDDDDDDYNDKKGKTGIIGKKRSGKAMKLELESSSVLLFIGVTVHQRYYSLRELFIEKNIILMASHDQQWYMHTGATSHFSSHTGNLQISSLNRNFHSVIVENESSIPVINSGHVQITNPYRSLHLRNVHVTPNIIKNLVSVRKFTTDNKCFIDFDPYGFIVRDYHTRQTLLRCDSTCDLYPLHVAAPAFALLTNNHSLWH